MSSEGTDKPAKSTGQPPSSDSPRSNHPPPAKQDFATRAIRVGGERSSLKEHGDPIVLSSSFVFDSAEQAAQVFAGEQPGYVYSRYTNPTVIAFEERLASLEGADFCLATSSGMAALVALCLCTLQPGDRMVSSSLLFGTSFRFLQSWLPRLGVHCDFVSPTDLDGWRKALSSGARLAFVETPSNPGLQIADIPAIAKVCEQSGTALAVDNTLCTAAILRPLELGAQWSLVSATKWLDGQGRAVGGALLGLAASGAQDLVSDYRRICGPSISAFDAWIFLKGLETLEVRIRHASESAMQIATWLCGQSAIEQIYYPGLPEHPGHELARRHMRSFGALISFRLAGGQRAAWRFIDATRMLSITANLGDVRSTLTHPATTTHRSLSDEEKAAAEITPGLVRLTVGLESVADICADIQLGLQAL